MRRAAATILVLGLALDSAAAGAAAARRPDPGGNRAVYCGPTGGWDPCYGPRHGEPNNWIDAGLRTIFEADIWEQHFSLFFLRWFCAVSSDIVRDAIELVFKRPLGDVYALFFGLVVGTSLTVGLVAAFVVGTCAIVALCLSFVLACGTLVGRRRGAEGVDRQRALEIESD